MSKEFIRSFADMRSTNNNVWADAAMQYAVYSLFTAFMLLVLAECGERGLQRQFKLADLPSGDEWGDHCEKLVRYMNKIDPTGETFRYPHDLRGRSFQYTYVEFDGLVKAHHNLTMYCGASIDVLGEYRGSYY
jgi:hypothetical protein